MDATVLGVLSGVLGSLVGGSATVATAWLTQRTANKREMAKVEYRKRESLYGEFIAECSKLLIDATTHSLDKPETMLNAYALLNRIRLSASPAVLKEAERLLRQITEQYFSKNLTVEEVRELERSEHADPLRVFGEACRKEFASISARL
jgi:hypothetical protein